MGTADFILLAAAAYAALGMVFGVLFAVAGVGRVDHAAIGAPWSFRLLIWPGAAALWPLMLSKWIHAARSAPDGEHTP
jgi:hypothetical protein